MSASNHTPVAPPPVDPPQVAGTVTDLASQRRTEATPGATAELEALTGALEARVHKLERQNRLSKLLLLLALAAGAYFVGSSTLGEGLVIKRTLMESKELKLLDNDGTARLFLRMYSRVPVMQVMDSGGRPRISLGLRFDDSPFLVLSDEKGNKRFSLEMNGDGDAALRLLAENGDVKFSLQ